VVAVFPQALLTLCRKPVGDEGPGCWRTGKSASVKTLEEMVALKLEVGKLSQRLRKISDAVHVQFVHLFLQFLYGKLGTIQAGIDLIKFYLSHSGPRCYDLGRIPASALTRQTTN
jgi:hypothetical protein